MTEAVILRAHQAADDDWIVERHGTLYAEAEGFDESFATLVAGILAEYHLQRDPERERGWIAEAKGQRLGCIFCFRDRTAGPEVAKLRMFLIEPEARGTGLAQRLLEACMGFARDAGYTEMRLWTHRSHAAAGRLYARNGFALEREMPVHSFGLDLIEQFWSRAL
jgi:GNAT superfamily N-acetyltransferase